VSSSANRGVRHTLVYGKQLRLYHMELAKVHPIVYAMKGPNMSTYTFRKITQDVIAQSGDKGLHMVNGISMTYGTSLTSR
jgi:hypothetical protein